MSDISPRRRFTGRAAIATAFLAVPLTASICYAEDKPGLMIASAQAAEATVDEWTDADVRQEEIAEAEVEIERELDEATEELAEAEREMAEARREIVKIERELADGDSKTVTKRRIVVNGKDWDKLDPEERAQLKAEMAELRAQFAEGGEFQMEMKKLREQFGENGEFRREIRLAMAEAREGAQTARLEVTCGDQDKRQDFAGTIICDSKIHGSALAAIREARQEIATDSDLDSDLRAEILKSLDAKIAEIERKN